MIDSISVGRLIYAYNIRVGLSSIYISGFSLVCAASSRHHAPPIEWAS